MKRPIKSPLSSKLILSRVPEWKWIEGISSDVDTMINLQGVINGFLFSKYHHGELLSLENINYSMGISAPPKKKKKSIGYKCIGNVIPAYHRCENCLKHSIKQCILFSKFYHIILAIAQTKRALMRTFFFSLIYNSTFRCIPSYNKDLMYVSHVTIVYELPPECDHKENFWWTF